MNATTRSKQARLEAIMARHDGYERRTLADLRRAGFSFTAISSARRRLHAQRTLARLTSEQRHELLLTTLESS